MYMNTHESPTVIFLFYFCIQCFLRLLIIRSAVNISDITMLVSFQFCDCQLLIHFLLINRFTIRLLNVSYEKYILFLFADCLLTIFYVCKLLLSFVGVIYYIFYQFCCIILKLVQQMIDELLFVDNLPQFFCPSCASQH